MLTWFDTEDYTVTAEGVCLSVIIGAGLAVILGIAI